MALVEQVKKGGRYTKKEQEERKIQVYHLHFEKGHSAVKISDLLDVNRNTINDDIKFWYSQMIDELGNDNLRTWVMKQFTRFEIQRNRLLENLENYESLSEKLAIEKLLFNIDSKSAQFMTTIITNVETTTLLDQQTKTIGENEIKKIVKELIKKSGKEIGVIHYEDNEILYEIIKMKKCDCDEAELILRRMKELGLNLCEVDHSYDTYDIGEFGLIRQYISNDELSLVYKRKEKLEDEQLKLLDELKKKFIQKYGPESNWSEEIREKFYASDE